MIILSINLNDLKKNTQDHIVKGVIDEYRKASYLWDNMEFDQAVTPGTNAGTLTYGYTRVTTEGDAGFRELNNEYGSQQAKKERKTVDLKIFGGKFEVDRIAANTGGLVDEVQFQLEQKIKATKAVFHNTVINGDENSNNEEFDGLKEILQSEATEKDALEIDLSNTDKLDDNYKEFLDILDEWLAEFNEKPSVIMTNSKTLTKLKAVARRAGYLTQSEDAFGRKVDKYDGIPLLDLGQKPASTDAIIETNDGLTDIYGVKLGMDGFHGVTLKDADMIQVYMPDFNSPGAVKSGEVEAIMATVLKNTRAAGRMKNVRIIGDATEYGTIVVYCEDDSGEELKLSIIEEVEVDEEQTITAPTIDGYSLVSGEESEKTVTITEEGEEELVKFVYEEDGD